VRHAALLLLVGCYAPTIEAGGACELECPGDLVCVDSICREPGFVPPDTGGDGPPGDADGDGIADDVDNCPARANADQHDEDADSRGDACDPCPHLSASSADLDTDGDGIGDGCDPQPMLANQTLAYFDPFTMVRAEWTHSPEVTIANDELRLAGDENFTRLAVANGETRIIVGGTVASVATASPHQLSMEFGANGARTELHLVQFFDGTGNPGDVSITKKIGNDFPDLAKTPYSGTLPTGAFALQVDASVAKQQVTLATTLGGMVMPTLTAKTDAAPALTPGADISLFERNADFRFDYILVIETMP
jgi:hypothetical protein